MALLGSAAVPPGLKAGDHQTFALPACGWFPPRSLLASRTGNISTSSRHPSPLRLSRPVRRPIAGRGPRGGRPASPGDALGPCAPTRIGSSRMIGVRWGEGRENGRVVSSQATAAAYHDLFASVVPHPIAHSAHFNPGRTTKRDLLPEGQLTTPLLVVIEP